MKKNLKKWQRAGSLFLLIGMILSVFSISAFGETVSRSAEVTIPVSVEAAGEAPIFPEDYTVRITPIGSAPLPDPAGEFYDLVLTGPGTADFPPIVYQKVGIYRYFVSQVAGNYPDAHYDTDVYDLTVTVTNAEGENGLIATVALKKDGMKQEDAKFINSYFRTPVSGGDDPPSPDTPEDPPSVDPPEEGPTDEPPTEPDTPEDPPPVDPPEEGPTDEPPTKPDKPIILRPDDPDPETLIQTGQLEWPVWLLGGLGAVLIALGALSMKKGRGKM